MYDIEKHRQSDGANQYELFEEPSQPKWPFRVALAVIVGVIAVLFAPLVMAQEAVKATYCNTVEEMVEAVTTNVLPAKVGDVTPCGPLVAIVFVGEKKTTVLKGNTYMDIYEVLVVAVHNGAGFIQVAPERQYVAKPSSDKAS